MAQYGKPFIGSLKERSIAYKKLGQKEKAKADLALIEELKSKEQKTEEKQKKPINSPAAKKQLQLYLKVREKHAATIKLCTAEIELNDRDAKAYCTRGQSLIEQWEHKNALKDLNRAIQLKRDYAAAYYYRGVCHSDLKYDIKALNDYTKAISLNPNISSAYRERARIYNTLGDFENEIADLEKLEELCSWDSFTYGRLGKLYEETGKYEQAVSFYTRSISQKYHWDLESFIGYTSYNGDLSCNQMIQKLNAAIGQSPENAALYVLRGKYFLRGYKFHEAITDLSKAIELQPTLIIAYVFRISAYTSSGSDTVDLKKADLLKAIKLNDTIMFLHLELGLLYKSTGKNKLAIKSFDKVLVIDPECTEVYRERSKVHEAMHEYQAAIDDIDSYVNQEVTRIFIEDAYTRKGDLFCKMGEYGKALIDYSAAIKQLKQYNFDVDDRLAKLFEKRGKCYEALQEEAKAKVDFSKAAKLKKKLY